MDIEKNIMYIFGDMEKRITFAPPLNTDVHLQSAKIIDKKALVVKKLRLSEKEKIF